MTTNQPSSLRVLVTGATGFLGAAVVRQLRAAGYWVRGTGRMATHPTAADEFLPADLRDANAIPRLLAGTDVVVHCAGLAHQFGRRRATDDEYYAINTRATEALVQAAVRYCVRHLVLVSSVAGYSAESAATREADASCLPSPYAISKYQAEQRAQELVAETDVRLTTLRMTTIYGAGDPGNMARLIRAIAGGRFVWIGDGGNRKTLIHVSDAAGACLAAIHRRTPPQLARYDVAATTASMAEVVATIEKLLGRQPGRWRLPAGIAIGSCRLAARWFGPRSLAARLQNSLNKWVSDEVYDGARFATQCAWAPTVSLAAGLADEVSWLVNSQSHTRRSKPRP